MFYSPLNMALLSTQINTLFNSNKIKRLINIIQTQITILICVEPDLSGNFT